MELSKRQQQVASLIQEELSQDILRQGVVPLGVLATITEVFVSPDIEHATISFSIFPLESEQKVMQILSRSIVDFQHTLNRRLHMRFVPQLYFKIDQGAKKGAENEEKMADLL